MSLYDLSGEQLKVPEVCTVSRQQQQRQWREGRGEQPTCVCMPCK